jgi:ribonuclease G
MRLRDLGGIIIVDFIDMKLPDNKKKLADAMDQFMKVDRAKHAVLPITKFGLMQITRQRMKPEMNINTSEVCPSCDGTGKFPAHSYWKMKFLKTSITSSCSATKD